MTTEQLEYSKKIAEFMEIIGDKGFGYSGETGLKYHSSWDWLMPVWFKCKKIGLFMMTNGFDSLWLDKSKEIESAIVNEINCDLAARRISYLIDWYNKNKTHEQ
jgi:hypothetical protein